MKKSKGGSSMNLQKLLLTENECYKAGEKITPKGIMVHSTGANNPKLSRYVGPDDGKLGTNKFGNHWNQPKPGGRQVCVHAFIGKLKNGSVATYQTLPWNYRGWHAGGSANNTHIGFEICEDNLKDAKYFGKVYQEAVELCAHLCKLYGLTEKDIVCHSEGHKKGIASNHTDVMHWFPKHGKSMDTLRADVKALLSTSEKKPDPVKPKPAKPEPEADLKVGDRVRMQRGATVYGKSVEFTSWVYQSILYVREVKGSRVVVATLKAGAVTGAVDKKYLVRM
jgi:hypothetical protein